MSVQKKQKKQISLKQNKLLFKACEVNDQRKSLNKLWVDIKEESLPIVEESGGFVIGTYKNKDYSIEIIKKNTTRFDVKSFKEKHPEIYESFLIGGESTELKTKYKSK